MGDAPAPQIPMRAATADDLPRAAASMLKRLGIGWRHRATYALGPIKRTPIDPDLRRQVTVWEQTESLALRLAHRDGGSAVAIWLRRPGANAVGKRYPWAFEVSWAWTRCTAPGCQNRGFEHPLTTPALIPLADLKVLLSDEPVLAEVA